MDAGKRGALSSGLPDSEEGYHVIPAEQLSTGPVFGVHGDKIGDSDNSGISALYY
jgi:hypothetical protein